MVESQQGRQRGRRGSSNRLEKLPFFLCIHTIINQEVEGKVSQTIMGYDCSSQRDLKVWDAFTRCKALAELMGHGAAIPEVKRVKKKKQLICYIKGNSADSAGAEYVQKA